MVLSLRVPVTAADTVLLTYLAVDGRNNLRDTTGNEVESFTDDPVTHETPYSDVRVSSARLVGTTLTVTFGEAVSSADQSTARAFRGLTEAFSVIGILDRGYAHPEAVTVSGTTVTLTLNSVTPGDRNNVRLSYDPEWTDTPLLDADGNPVAHFADQPVDYATGGRPVLERAEVVAHGAGREQTTLRLTFDKVLDGASRPAGSAFGVYVSDPKTEDQGRFRATGTASILGADVEVTLPTGVDQASGVSVFYDKPDTSPLQDGTHNEVADFQERTAAVLDRQSPAYVSGSVTGRRVTLHFDEVLDDRFVPARGDFAVTVEGSGRGVDTVGFSGSAITLSLASATAAGQSVTASYTPGQYPIRDLAANEAAGFASEALTNLGASDPGAPTLATAAAFGTTVTLTFSQPLDASAVPAPEVFGFWHVPAEDGRSGHVAAAVSVRGNDVVLDLNGQVYPCASGVTVRYEKPDTNALRNLFGTEADGFTGSDAELLTNRRAGKCAEWRMQGQVSGDTLMMGMGRALRADSKLPGRAFRVTATPPHGSARAIEGTGTARIDGETVSVTLASPVAPDETATMSYRRPSGEAGLLDTSGSQLADFGPEPVENTVPAPEPAPNSPATGAPTIAGTARVGETLTASTAGIADADGLTGATFAYQWLSNSGGADADIAGATGASYTLADAQTGRRVKVRVAFTDDAGHVESLTSVATAAVVRRPLTARFVGVPAEHDGKRAFSFELRFSENFPGRLSYKVFKDHALKVTNGRAIGVKRAAAHQNQRWTITVRPWSFEDVTVTLAAATDCEAPGSVCTEAGRKLSNTVTATVQGPPLLSVADAEAREGEGAAVEFAVTLSRAASGTVTVNYATADGTAKAGEDYTATSGTLTFALGEREKAVAVPLLDDALDEGEETFLLRLSNATGAVISDRVATGTIVNAESAAEDVALALRAHGGGPCDGGGLGPSCRPAHGRAGDGGRAARRACADGGPCGADAGADCGRGYAGRPGGAGAREGGQIRGGPRIGSGAGGAGLGLRGPPTLDSAPAREISGRELLLGSAFHLAREGDGAGPGLAAWGRVTVGGFDGEAPADDGNVGIDGEVTTGILGADAAWDRLLAGVAVSVSEGEGTFDQPGVDSGTIESTLTTVSPYARAMVSDRVSVWGLAGFGIGDMTVVQAANDRGQPERVTRTDIGMRLAALGGRGALMQANEAGGLDLALEADAFYVETESEAISNEGGTMANASRVRLALEGSRAFQVGGGTLTPGLELGLRHDGGDAETGTGVELGGRVAYADPETGLSVEARVRALVAHEDSNYREWGASGAVRLAPGERGRGLSFSLAPTWGRASSGVDRLWSARDARGLAPGETFEPERRLEGEIGYGLGLFGDRFTGTPNLGLGFSDSARDWRVGWRLTPAVPGNAGFQLSLDAMRRESANDAAPEHAIGLELGVRW